MAETRLRVLDRAELPVDTVQFARFLIGKMLRRVLAAGVVSGRIVETEAYDIGDPAGHAYRGMTPRNRSLFLERGLAYVDLAYGTSFMLNVSSERPGVGAGVLIRAIQLAKGAALGIDRRLDGIDLCRDGPLSLARRRSGIRRHRAEQTDRHHARGRQTPAILRSREWLRERPADAQQMKGFVDGSHLPAQPYTVIRHRRYTRSERGGRKRETSWCDRRSRDPVHRR